MQHFTAKHSTSDRTDRITSPAVMTVRDNVWLIDSFVILNIESVRLIAMFSRMRSKMTIESLTENPTIVRIAAMTVKLTSH